MKIKILHLHDSIYNETQLVQNRKGWLAGWNFTVNKSKVQV